MNQKEFINIIIVIVVVLVGVGSYFILNRPLSSLSPSGEIKNFEECARIGYPVGESYPRQCWTPDGKRFVETIEQDTLPTSGPVTIFGTIACLTKNGSFPQTLECAIGLEGTDGQYYELKNLFKLDLEYKFSSVGMQVEVSGIFSTEQAPGPASQKYDVVGTVDVTSIKEITDGSNKSNSGTVQP